MCPRRGARKKSHKVGQLLGGGTDPSSSESDESSPSPSSHTGSSSSNGSISDGQSGAKEARLGTAHRFSIAYKKEVAYQEVTEQHYRCSNLSDFSNISKNKPECKSVFSLKKVCVQGAEET